MAVPATNVIDHKVHVVRAKQNQDVEEFDIDDLVSSLEQDYKLSGELAEARQWLAHGAGEGLTQVRLSKGLSQKQLAEKVGLRQPNISAIESGKRKPEYPTALKIAGALDISIDQLYALLENSSRG